MKHSFHHNVDQILDIYREVLARRDGLPHGYRVLQARISGGDLRGARPQGTRLLDIFGAGVKK